MNAIRDYGAPLLAVDQILELNDKGIRTAKEILGNEPYFLGHYPDYPIFPGVFVLEAVHQSVRCYVDQRLGLSRLRLAQLKSMRFLSPLRPGDRLEVICQCTLSTDQDELLVEADCRSGDDTPVARIKLRYALDRE